MPLTKSNYGIIGNVITVGNTSSGFLSGRVDQQLLQGTGLWPMLSPVVQHQEILSR